MLGLFSRWQLVRRYLRMRYREWLTWAFDHPDEAAFALRGIARLLRLHNGRRRRPNGWLGRWEMAIADALDEQAAELERVKCDETGECLRQVCAVKPGTWKPGYRVT